MTGKELQTIRKKAKITQNQMSDLMGVSLQTISNYESSTELPSGKSEYIINFYKNVGSKGVSAVSEDRPEYGANSEKEILKEILSEVKYLRRSNEKLTSAFNEMKDESDQEKKKNESLRQQLKLAINVLRALDQEIVDKEKLPSAENNAG